MSLLPAEWLLSPDDGQPLLALPHGGYTDATGARQYPVVAGAWLALPLAGQPAHYAEHYQHDAEYFDYHAEWTDDPGARHENRRLREWILHSLPATAERVLDVGCGAAWLAKALLPQGKTVVSMDISTVNPQRAVAKYPSPRHFAVVADVYHLPFCDGLFDAIVAAEIIEHVPDPAAFLAALLRVLRPGGRLIVTTPYAEKIVYSLCIHCNRPTPHSAHLHSFTPAKLLEMLPPAAQAGARTEVAVNKVLLKLRTHLVLRFLPFGAWRLLDRLANSLWRRPARLKLLVDRAS